MWSYLIVITTCPQNIETLLLYSPIATLSEKGRKATGFSGCEISCNDPFARITTNK